MLGSFLPSSEECASKVKVIGEIAMLADFPLLSPSSEVTSSNSLCSFHKKDAWPNAVGLIICNYLLVCSMMYHLTMSMLTFPS